MEPNKIRLDEWAKASTEQRQLWLKAGASFTKLSGELYQWVCALREKGATITDEVMLALYRDMARYGDNA